MLLRSLVLLGLTLGACRAADRSEARSVSAGSTGRDQTGMSSRDEYHLMLFENMPLPAYDSNPMPSGCSQVVRDGAFTLDSTHWSFLEHLSQGCGEHRMPRREITDSASGRVVRNGDTLAFQSFDSAQRVWSTSDRGLRRADSLITGGQMFDGPQRVYLRRR